MTEPRTAIEPLSFSDVAFEHFEEFFESIIEHAQSSPEQQLAERPRLFEKCSEALRSSLHQQTLDWGVRKVEGLEFSFTVKKNPPKVQIVNEDSHSRKTKTFQERSWCSQRAWMFGSREKSRQACAGRSPVRL